MNINEIKKELQSLGLPTTTPGLQGDERFEELSYRLETAKKNTHFQEKVKSEVSQAENEFVVPSLNMLSIGEIRSRLNALGESTNTPGITGEERRTVLMNRLINSICMDNDAGHIHEITSISPAPSAPEEANANTSSPTAAITENMPIIVPPIRNEVVEDSDIIVTSTIIISNLKKELKRLINQRAMYVASKLSGNLQDENLKNEEMKLSRIDNELSKFRQLQQKGDKTIHIDNIQSEFLVLNPNNKELSIESVVNRLEGYRSSTKDKIRDFRFHIREEGDLHPLYGIAMEEKLKIQLSEANLTSAANANAKVSRTRQKLNDSKKLESSLSIQQKNDTTSTSSYVNNSNSTKEILQEKALQDTATVTTTTTTGIPMVTTIDSSPIGKNSSQKTGPMPPLNSPPKDKWSTDIFPLGSKPTPVPTQPSMNKAGSSKKLPDLTSSFLGKAIDLDSVNSTSATTLTAAHSTREKEEKKKNSSDNNKTPSLLDKQVSGMSTATAAMMSTSTANAALNSAVVAKGVPVVQGRRPPPLPTNAAHRRDNPSPEPVAHSRDGDIEVYDETDAFFQEADEAAVFDESLHYTSSSAKVFPMETKTNENIQPAGLSRSIPNKDTLELSDGDDDDEEEELGHSTSVSDHDYDEVYGTMRVDTTAEGEDDDLEELARSAVQSRCGSATNSAKSSARRSNDMASPQPAPAQVAEGASGILRMPSIDEHQEPVIKPAVRVSVQDTAPHIQETAVAEPEAVQHTMDYVIVDSPRHSSSGSDHDAAVGREHQHEHEHAEEGDDDGEGDGDHTGEHHHDKEDEEEIESDEKTQIRVLRNHAKVLEGLNDISAAEEVYMRALELDPINITTLEHFAIFLHQKKGELLRAEAFFNRGLQICLPGIHLKATSTSNNNSAANTPTSIGSKNIGSSNDGTGNGSNNNNDNSTTTKSNINNATTTNTPTNTTTSNMMNSNISFHTDASMQGNKISSIIKFLINYAYFMYKSKGDVDYATLLYKKGLEIDPDNRHLLATYAYFLGQLNDTESSKLSIQLFQKVLKLIPSNIQYILWYAKILKKNKKLNESELMYKVAYERSKGNTKYEPISICNYATFIYKQRKDKSRASALFQIGLELYPKHKGLKKNYATLLKSMPKKGHQQEGQQQQYNNEEESVGGLNNDTTTTPSSTTTTTTATTPPPTTTTATTTTAAATTTTTGNARAEWLARRAQAAEDQRKLLEQTATLKESDEK